MENKSVDTISPALKLAMKEASLPGRRLDERAPTENLFYSVIDREAPLRDCPAITTLLLNVCNRDKDKFEEACRLVLLFMEAAYELGKKNSGA